MSKSWYPFYPGDFERDTRDLSPSEVGLYIRLLNYMYSTGREIQDLKTAFRIAGAETKKEKQQIGRILDRFFVQKNDFFVHRKVQEILSQQSAKSTKAKESAEKRWYANAYANASKTHMLDGCYQNQNQNNLNKNIGHFDDQAIGHSPDENANLISEAVEHVKNDQPLPTYQNDKTDTVTAQQTALEFAHDQNSKPQKQKKVSANDALEGEFVQWYGLYPLKVAKQNAKKAFFNARKKVSLETLINGLESYKKNKPEYAQWAHPASWLNAGRWEDETPNNKTIVPVNTKREALFFAYKNQMPLRHITLGVLAPERLTPVDARYQPVEIESAKMIRVDNGNAYGLQEFSTA